MKGGVGDCEQEVTSKRKRKEERMRDVMCLGMAGILTEMSSRKVFGDYHKHVHSINANAFCQVPGRAVWL
jgi:hypothetical protein